MSVHASEQEQKETGEPSPSQHATRDLLVRTLRPYWPQLLFLLFLLLFGMTLDLLNPYILSTFIDQATNAGTFSVLGWLIGGFFLVVVLQQIISVVEHYVAGNIQMRTTNTLRADLLEHCLGLDLTFYQKYLPGELIERVDGDISTLGNFFSRFIVSILSNALLLIGVLVLLYTLDWRVGLAMTAFALIAILYMRGLQGAITPWWEKVRQAEADLYGFLEERFSGTEDIRSSGATTYMLRGHIEHSRVNMRVGLWARMITHSMYTGMGWIFTLGTMLALGLGIWLFSTGGISVGKIYLIVGYTGLLHRPLAEFHNQIQDIQKALAGLRRMREFLLLRSSLKDGAGVDVPEGALSVEFDNVSFAYADTPVLKNLSFMLPAGSIMGILGRTGSGKTTITKLTERFYDPVEGEIRLGNEDLRQWRLDDLRTRVSMITQEVHLFNASVRDNLTLFHPQIPDERIIEVIELLGLGGWFRALPEGLDTKLSTEGNGLSAGEAQLLAFVRVFLKDPDLVILDEASSRLDPATEQQIEQAMHHLLQGRTAIIIAHRLATVERADTILILEDGQCCEYGSRTALAADVNSRFAHLLRTGLEGLKTFAEVAS